MLSKNHTKIKKMDIKKDFTIEQPGFTGKALNLGEWREIHRRIIILSSGGG